MPQSLSKVIVHLIFSTRDRESWLDRKVRQRIHAYLATICRDLGAQAHRVGGVADHVHIITTLPRTISQAQMVEQVKGEEDLIKMDQEPRARISWVFLATWIWRVFGQPQPTR